MAQAAFITATSQPDPATALNQLLLPFGSLNDAGAVDHARWCPEDPAHDERFLEAVDLAIDQCGDGGYNQGFLRPGGVLVVFGINGDVEDDQSPLGYSVYLQHWLAALPDPSLASWSYIADGPTVNSSAVAGHFAADTGGVVLNSLDNGWTQKLLALVTNKVKPEELPLGARPDPSTIQVEVNGIPVPRIDPASSTKQPEGQYDGRTNAVFFSVGYIPAGGATVSVTYTLSC